jgi:uncharacterized protein (UPF0335 family)
MQKRQTETLHKEESEMSEMQTGGVATQVIRQIVERIEAVNAEIEERNEFKSDIFQEAKSNGFCTKALKAVIAERKKIQKNSAAFNETVQMIELYRHALGMQSQIDLFNEP